MAENPFSKYSQSSENPFSRYKTDNVPHETSDSGAFPGEKYVTPAVSFLGGMGGETIKGIGALTQFANKDIGTSISEKGENAIRAAKEMAPISATAGQIGSYILPGVGITKLGKGLGLVKALGQGSKLGRIAEAGGIGAATDLATQPVERQNLDNFAKEKGLSALKTGAISAAIPGAFQLAKGTGKLGADLLGSTARKAERLAKVGINEEANKAATEAARQYSGFVAPSDKSTLGQKISDKLQSTLGRLTSQRGREAGELKQAYFGDAKAKQKLGEFWANSAPGREFLSNLTKSKSSELSGKFTNKQHEIINNLVKNLTPLEKGSQRDIEVIDAEIRRLKGLAGGPPREGYEAIDQQFMGDLAGKLEDSVYQYAPKGKDYRAAYAEASKPINEFEARTGLKATENATDRGSEFLRTDPQLLPDTFFKSKQSVAQLRNFLRGDEAAIRKLASEHVSTELQGLSGPEAAKWLSKNREWLNDIPGLKDNTSGYVDNLMKNEIGSILNSAKSDRIKEVFDDKIEKYVKEFGTLNPKEMSSLRSKVEEIDRAYTGQEKRRRLFYVIGSALGFASFAKTSNVLDKLGSVFPGS